MIENGTRADIARKRFEDTNQLTGKNMIYIGTGEKEDLGNSFKEEIRYIYKTEGKNIISAINDAGVINEAHHAETADQATNAESAKIIVSEDGDNPTIIKGKSDNNQSRIIPLEDNKVDLGALNYKFNTVYAKTFTGTADAAINTSFSNEIFSSYKGDHFYLRESGFYYIYLQIDLFNLNFGIICWDKNYDAYSPITTIYNKEYGSFRILCDEYFIRITGEGLVSFWKKDAESEGWEKIDMSQRGDCTIFYKKIR